MIYKYHELLIKTTCRVFTAATSLQAMLEYTAVSLHGRSACAVGWAAGFGNAATPVRRVLLRGGVPQVVYV
jgi:hypothetical protein